MPLNDPHSGLRPIHNGSKSPLKPQLVVQPGDELYVSDDVAAQLLADPAFKDAAAPEQAAETVEDAKPKRARKSAD